MYIVRELSNLTISPTLIEREKGGQEVSLGIAIGGLFYFPKKLSFGAVFFVVWE